MVGVQDEQHVQRMLEDRVRLVLELRRLPHHVEEVAGVRQVVVRVGVAHADRVPVRERGECRDLRDQAGDLEPAYLLVVDRLGLGIERRECTDRADQNAHRVRVMMEAVDELLDVLVDERVVRDVVLPGCELLLVGELAVDQQVGHLEERALLGQLVDRIAAVAQDPGGAIDEGHRAAAARGVRERRVVGQQPEIIVVDLDLA